MDGQSGWTEFLREAVKAGESGLVLEALARGADPNVDVYGDGHTPLYWAVSGGRFAEAEALLAAGAVVAREDRADASSLHAAAEDGDVRLARLLLGADGRVALNWFDYVDRTPLMCAVQNGDTEMVRLLLEAGADVNAQNEARAGDTALHLVAANGTAEMARLLLEAGADPNAPGGMGLTPLHQSHQRKRPEGRTVCALLERAAQSRRERWPC